MRRAEDGAPRRHTARGEGRRDGGGIAIEPEHEPVVDVPSPRVDG